MFLSGYLRTYLRTAALSHDRWPSTSVKQGMRQSKWGLKTQQQHAIMYRLCLSGRSDSSKVSSRSHQKTLPSPRACSLGSDLNTHTNAARDSSDQGGGSAAGKSPWSSVLTAANALRSHWSPSLTHLRPVGTCLYFTCIRSICRRILAHVNAQFTYGIASLVYARPRGHHWGRNALAFGTITDTRRSLTEQAASLRHSHRASARMSQSTVTESEAVRTEAQRHNTPKRFGDLPRLDRWGTESRSASVSDAQDGRSALSLSPSPHIP